jgi:hypothetical protein
MFPRPKCSLRKPVLQQAFFWKEAFSVLLAMKTGVWMSSGIFELLKYEQLMQRMMVNCMHQVPQ